jgi:hypothetical protein
MVLSVRVDGMLHAQPSGLTPTSLNTMIAYSILSRFIVQEIINRLG